MIKYVCGFMFNGDKTNIALIRKNRPEFQNGLLNGIGGKVEDYELSNEAMCREFREETGFDTYLTSWNQFLYLRDQSGKYCIDFYYHITDDTFLDGLKTTTDEEVVITHVSNLDYVRLVPNLKWIIRMCLDENVKFAEVIVN